MDIGLSAPALAQPLQQHSLPPPLLLLRAAPPPPGLDFPQRCAALLPVHPCHAATCRHTASSKSCCRTQLTIMFLYLTDAWLLASPVSAQEHTLQPREALRAVTRELNNLHQQPGAVLRYFITMAKVCAILTHCQGLCSIPQPTPPLHASHAYQHLTYTSLLFLVTGHAHATAIMPAASPSIYFYTW
jgi:hypothetical protein